MQNYNDFSRFASRYLLTQLLGMSYYCGKPLTLHDISDFTGLTKSNLSNVRTGKTSFTLNSFFKVCSMMSSKFGVSLVSKCFSDILNQIKGIQNGNS